MIGKLRNRIEVQRRATTKDSLGQPADTWITVARCWARVRPISGREFYAQSGEHAELTHEVTFRYGTDCKAQDRIVHAGRFFDVQSVVDIEERNRFNVARCIENADDN